MNVKNNNMELPEFESITYLVLNAYKHLEKENGLQAMLIYESKKYKIIFTKSDATVFDYVVLDNGIENPTLFGEGYIDSGTGNLGFIDFTVNDLMTIFYKI